MSIIEVANLVKEFRRPKKVSGRFSGIRTLLTREYVSTLAVNDVSFRVGEGEIVSFLGPNGAGKSTTIKILTGILRPTSGEVRVAGLVPWQHRQINARNIGVVFGQRTQLWWDLPLIDSLELIGKLYGMSRPHYMQSIERFTDALDVGPFLQTPVRQLSLGQRMRGDLAAAMLPDPAILYLDEPTVGLDVVAKRSIRELIETFNREQGATVVLTTHDLDDVEHLSSRIVLIDGGRVLHDGAISALKGAFAHHRELVVRLQSGQSWQAACLLSLVHRPEVRHTNPGTVVLRFDPSRSTVPDLINAVLAHHSVSDLSINDPALEDVVHHLYAASKP